MTSESFDLLSELTLFMMVFLGGIATAQRYIGVLLHK